MGSKLTQERLKELLHYNPETGVFTWRVRSCNRWPEIGRVAGTPDGKGYLMVGIDGTRYKLHRLAALYMIGQMPPEQVDHQYGQVQDNRWDRLRLATQSQNMQNRRTLKSNSSGYPGVHWSQSAGAWIARISAGGVRKYLGLFQDKVEAHAAYLKAKAALHQFQPIPRTQ